jgi:glutamyl-tRNA reductase
MVRDYVELQEVICETDIIIVATGAQKATINKSLVRTQRPLLIIDLSIPRNVDENVQELSNVTLLHLDDLSQITDEAIENRQLEVPKAQVIIQEIQADFYDWCQTRRFVPTLKALQNKLHEIKTEELSSLSKKDNAFDSAGAELVSDQLIQKITSQLAHHFRNNSQQTDDQIELIQSVFQLNVQSHD